MQAFWASVTSWTWWDWTRVIGAIAALYAIYNLSRDIRRWWQRRTHPKGGEEFPREGSELRQAQVVQRHRFVLQALCLAFYKSRHGKRAARPARLVRHGDRGGIDLPLLAVDGWIPSSPISLHEVSLGWDENSPPAKTFDPNFDRRLETELKKPRLRDDPVYRLISISRAPASALPRFIFAIDTYRSYVNTCEVMLWSLAAKVAQYLMAHGYAFFLPDRELSLLMRAAPKLVGREKHRKDYPPLPLNNRCASVGINTLTVLRRSGTFPIFLMHQRGEQLHEAPSTLHVLPAGTFQPILYGDREHNVEFDMNFTLLREFAEECYNDNVDIEERLSRSIFDIRARHAKFNGVLEMYERGLLRTFFLGATLDVVTLKPEVLTLCVADLDGLKKNIGPFEEQYEGKRIEYPFTQARVAELLKTAENDRTLAAAMGCLSLALKHFDHVEEQLATLPEQN